ncbi:MAG: hypothetical protein VXW20_07940, partial [Pseudomonadota bacterium]|nr:hypothetical protein [Pseudomonadota bacterium]
KHGGFKYVITTSTSPQQKQALSCGVHCCAHVVLATRGHLFENQRSFDEKFIDGLRDRALLFFNTKSAGRGSLLVNEDDDDDDDDDGAAAADDDDDSNNAVGGVPSTRQSMRVVASETSPAPFRTATEKRTTSPSAGALAAVCQPTVAESAVGGSSALTVSPPPVDTRV